MTVRESREHTASYYAATANAATDFPRLRGEHHCDVVVVGGGFTGVSTMLHLAERGYDVVLVEANRLGWGASGRNGGQLIDGFVNDDRIEKRFGKSAAEMTHRMGLECRNIVVKRIEQYGIDCDLTYGFIDLALRPADVKEFAERAEEYARSQYPHEIRVVPKDDVPKHVGSKSYIGGLINMGNGHLHPLNLCIGEATAAIELGAKVITMSDSGGFIHDPDGIDRGKLDWICDLKNVRRGRLEEYADQFPGVSFTSSDPTLRFNPMWDIPADCAFPCATQNEINDKDAQHLLTNGVKLVCEGANMPSNPESVDLFLEHRMIYGPGKAANAGGVAVSALEMAQNSARFHWPREEVDRRLQQIMRSIHDTCADAADTYGTPGNYVNGANIAGFSKVADAMLDQGLV